MILKYKVPPSLYGIMYGNKKVIYCRILKSTEDFIEKKIYLVKMINYHNISNVFAENELKRLNIIDRIKLIKKERDKYDISNVSTKR